MAVKESPLDVHELHIALFREASFINSEKEQIGQLTAQLYDLVDQIEASTTHMSQLLLCRLHYDLKKPVQPAPPLSPMPCSVFISTADLKRSSALHRASM